MNWSASKNILIKTYVHESGLWYLALSLAKHLEALGHQVKFIPKSKYIKNNGRFKKTYLLGIQSEKILSMNLDDTIGNQLIRYIKQYDIDVLISIETLMETASWIQEIKNKTKVEVIDLPMLEWVSPQYFNNGSYKQFDKIWAVTDQTYKTFQEKYLQIERVRWNFIDEEVFFNDQNPFGAPEFSFYHQGSLNPEFSSKNTDMVLKAFEKLNQEFPDQIRLIITGNLTNTNAQSIIKRHPKIKVFDHILSRKEIANIYSITNCVVAPSSKEGLSLSLFEAEACGCLLITTDAPPMNEHNTKYLCEVANFRKDKTLVPVAELTVDSIYKQMKKAYEENNYE